ncbi:MAG: bifunctional pyr operon transcriptional regulator/uracil phosphoribosyltransferase PyrR [Clostridia bacterium]|nr:bifunctional pyr operon transcriptional regulator/uracil phosphoribosyltransferase PyrR [Clostridia bacterium]
MDETAVDRALKRISHEILEKNQGGGGLCLLGIKRRGVPLAEKIAQNIFEIEGVKVPVGSLDITLYRDDLSEVSEEAVLNSSNIPFSVAAKKVVLVDDVLFTGRTARAALEAVMKFGRPEAVQLAVLVDRGHRELPIRGDYVGKNVPTAKNERVFVKMPPIDSVCSVEIFGE